MKKNIFFICLSLASINAVSQKKIDVTFEDVPETFLKNSSKVVVNRSEINEIVSQSTIRQKFSEINLIQNENGLDNLDKSIVYDKLSKIKDIEFKIYNAKGELVKTFKEKDFSDRSLADGFSVLTDNRMKYLEPKYYQYPFFTKFDYEMENENTIFVPPFSPIQSTEDRIMQATYQLNYPIGFAIKKVENNLEIFNVSTTSDAQSITYKVSNLSAPEYEELNTQYTKLLPTARFANNTFGLGNVKGVANTWDDFGVWYHTHFLNDLSELPESTINKMKALTKEATTDIEKAKIIFNYVQNNTRYISIQIGLGGWKPFAAKEVDKLGYGDCKALTNYTKSLLQAVGVTSYYTIIHAADKVVDINEETISLQGNHVILTLPTANGTVFLECTNQKIPFGYLGNSTNNRKALAIKPDGAFFVTTHSNTEKHNVLKGNFIVDISNLQKAKTKVSFENSGMFYNNLFYLNTKDTKEVNDYVKNVFSELKDLKIIKYQNLSNDDSYVIKEDIEIESAFIGSKMGNDYMLAANGIFKVVHSPKKYLNRKTGFSINRGKEYQLQTEYILPSDVKVDFKPESKTIESVFGKHVLDINIVDNKIVVVENFVLKSGDYTKEQYQQYEKFIADVIQSNYAKFILSKK